MLKHSILLFLGFLALASAAFTPEKNFFFLPSDSNLSTQLFQTRHGTIAYSVVLMESGQYYPSYVQINQETNNVTEIMQELTSDCGQGASAFDRFQYHVLTYSFVYYCTNNNSILILDAANNFSVQQAFSLSINQTFDEVRLTTDGYNIVIVGMSGLFTQNPGPSHLIKLSLQTQQIVNHVVFNHDLAAGEFVTAYGTNGNMFIITNIINSTTNIANVYAMTLIGNSYSLTRLSTFNSTSSFPYTLPEFYVNKNLIFASSEDSLVILDQNGNIQKVQEGVALNQFTMSATETLYRPAIVSYPGSGSVFVSLQNWTLLEFSLQNQGFNIQDRGVARSVSLAIQDQLTDTLFYSFGGQDDDFKMTNVDHSNVVYQSVSSFTNFMITDKTYCALTKLNYLEIFDLQTNDLIQEIQVSNSSYYDQKSSTFSFLYVNDSQVIFQQIDLTTGNNYTLPLSFTGADSAQLVHATNNERFDSPEITLHIPGSSDEYLIISQTFGQVNFVLDAPISPFNSTLAVDYDTLTVFYFLNSEESPSFVSVTEYNYVSSNKSFVSANTNQVTIGGDIDFIIPAIDYSVIGTPRQIGVIDMSSSSMNPTEYTISSQWTYPSTFQNSSNGFNMVLSQAQQWGAQGETESAGILYENQIEDLSGTTYNTVQAGTAGSCSYWVVNQVGSFGVVQFYNICGNDAVFEIIA